MQPFNNPTASQLGQTFAPKKKAINKILTPVSADTGTQYTQPVPIQKESDDIYFNQDKNTINGKPVNPPTYKQVPPGTLLSKIPKDEVAQPVPVKGEPDDAPPNYNPGAYVPPKQPTSTNTTAPTTGNTQGSYQSVNYQSVNSGASPSMDAPQTSFSPKDYQSDGYTGVQGETDYHYDPRSESLVQNQITGLLDPDSDIMRKARSQAQNYSASRGLQSSSIGSEVALSSMIDKALPIAQQDASTYANADQTGWQQSFTADQNNLNRTHDASMFDKQGKLQTDLQNDQLSFTNTQNNADRTLQTELQQLQYQQNLGLMDAEGAQRMQELNAQQGFQMDMQNLGYQQNLGAMDKQAALQERRDQILNQFDFEKMDQTFLNDLEKTKLTWEHDDAVFTRNLNGQFELEYKNASSDAYNHYLEQVGLVYSNPNMTPEQQQAGVAKLDEMFAAQRQQLQIIYGAGSGYNGGGTLPSDTETMGPYPSTPPPPNDQIFPTNPSSPNTGVAPPSNGPIPYVGGGSGGGGSKGGGRNIHLHQK